MQQKIDGGLIYVRATKEESAVIKSWRMMKWDKAHGWWYGDVSRALLERLKKNGGLIPPAQELLRQMDSVQAAVDRERIRPDPEVKPLCRFPVKPKLYTHQVRAANMALMTFGLIDPKEADYGDH